MEQRAEHKKGEDDDEDNKKKEKAKKGSKKTDTDLLVKFQSFLSKLNL